MKLAVIHGIGKELTRDELKNVFGGSDSKDPTPKIDACNGKKYGSFCEFDGIKEYQGHHFTGTCQWAPLQTGVLYCSDLNQ